MYPEEKEPIPNQTPSNDNNEYYTTDDGITLRKEANYDSKKRASTLFPVDNDPEVIV